MHELLAHGSFMDFYEFDLSYCRRIHGQDSVNSRRIIESKPDDLEEATKR